jgi:hypothetical protein
MFQSTTWWLDSGANVHVCSNVSLFLGGVLEEEILLSSLF